MQRHTTHWVTLSARGVNSRKYDISVRIRYLDKLVVRFHISITWTLGVRVTDIVWWIHLRFVPQEKSILCILQKHLTPAESLWSVPFAQALSTCAFISSTLCLLRRFSRAFHCSFCVTESLLSALSADSGAMLFQRSRRSCISWCMMVWRLAWIAILFLTISKITKKNTSSQRPWP